MLNYQQRNGNSKKTVKLLIKIENYEFRFKIIRLNKEKGITETKLSNRIPLKESLMFFNESKVIL